MQSRRSARTPSPSWKVRTAVPKQPKSRGLPTVIEEDLPQPMEPPQVTLKKQAAVHRQLLEEIGKCRSTIKSWETLHMAVAEKLRSNHDEIRKLRLEVARLRAYSPGIDVDMWSAPLTAADSEKRSAFYGFMSKLYAKAPHLTLRELHDAVQALPSEMKAYYDAYRRHYFLKCIKLHCTAAQRVDELEQESNARASKRLRRI